METGSYKLVTCIHTNETGTWHLRERVDLWWCQRALRCDPMVRLGRDTYLSLRDYYIVDDHWTERITKLHVYIYRWLGSSAWPTSPALVTHFFPSAESAALFKLVQVQGTPHVKAITFAPTTEGLNNEGPRGGRVARGRRSLIHQSGGLNRQQTKPKLIKQP